MGQAVGRPRWCEGRVLRTIVVPCCMMLLLAGSSLVVLVVSRPVVRDGPQAPFFPCALQKRPRRRTESLSFVAPSRRHCQHEWPWRSEFRKPRFGSVDGNWQKRKLPLEWTSLSRDDENDKAGDGEEEDLEGRLQKMIGELLETASIGERQKSPPPPRPPDLETDFDKDAPVLDEETYRALSLQSRDETIDSSPASLNLLETEEWSEETLLRGNRGSSNPFSPEMDAPSIPEEYMTASVPPHDDTMDTSDYLRQCAAEAAAKAASFASENTADEVYRQVFAQEEGYLEQSALFRQSLSQAAEAANRNNQVAEDAATLRRTAEYRRRQDEACELLERGIQELLEELEQAEAAKGATEEGNETNTTSTPPTCSGCGCFLGEDELQHAQQQGSTPDSILCRSCHSQASLTLPFNIINKPIPDNMVSGDSPRTRQPPRRTEELHVNSTTDEQLLRQYRYQLRAARDEIRQLKEEVETLQNIVKKYEDAASVTFRDEETEAPPSPWIQLEDPDAGEQFFVHEETGETRWDMEDLES